MKGVIVCAVRDLVKEKFGVEKWERILENAGVDKQADFQISDNIDDKIVMEVLKSLMEVLNLSLSEVADAFGDYWMNVYAPKIYGLYYQMFKSAKEFLLKTDWIHKTVTNTMEGARPPHFKYEWIDDKTLIMEYTSARGLIDLVIGLAKGVGKHFNENLKVTKISDQKVQVVFP